MCDVGLALMAGSTILAGVGAVQSAQATAEASRYNGRIAEMNAELSERRAKDAQQRGRSEEQRKRLQIAQLQGEQVAAMGANGVDTSFGSPLDTLVDTAVLGELDALTIRRNSAREAYDHRVAAANGRADAALSRYNADNALTAGYLDAAGTVLGGLGGTYREYKRVTIGSYG